MKYAFILLASISSLGTFAAEKEATPVGRVHFSEPISSTHTYAKYTILTDNTGKPNLIEKCLLTGYLKCLDLLCCTTPQKTGYTQLAGEKK